MGCLLALSSLFVVMSRTLVVPIMEGVDTWGTLLISERGVSGETRTHAVLSLSAIPSEGIPDVTLRNSGDLKCDQLC